MAMGSDFHSHCGFARGFHVLMRPMRTRLLRESMSGQAIFRQHNHRRARFYYWVRIKRLVTVTFRAQPERNIGMEVA